MSEYVTCWERTSEYCYVHDSGARIERRGYPEKPAWVLVGVDGIERLFDPSPAGCDEAFIAFSGRQAATEILSRLIA